VIIMVFSYVYSQSDCANPNTGSWF
jgi:hypothetical protein